MDWDTPIEVQASRNKVRDKPSGPQTELLYLKVVAREGDNEEEVE